MKKNGFTLIEMLVVMLVISVLLLITVPNVTRNNALVQGKGCEAFLNTVQSQIQAYKIENENKTPTLSDLKSGNYIKTTTCPGGNEIEIIDGTVREIENS